MKKILLSFIELSKSFGISEKDAIISKEYLEHNELGLCFDTIIVQLYEDAKEINKEFYSLIRAIAEKLKLPDESYSFMSELVRDENIIPQLVKNELSLLINDLENFKRGAVS